MSDIFYDTSIPNIEDKYFCVKNCEFLNVRSNVNENYIFWCELYSIRLEEQKTISENSIRPKKCQECIKNEEKWDTSKRISKAEEYLSKARNFIDLAWNEIEKSKS